MSQVLKDFWIKVERSDTDPLSDLLFGRWYWKAGKGVLRYDSGFAYTEKRAYEKAQKVIQEEGATTWDTGVETLKQTQLREWDEAFKALANSVS